MKEECGIKEGGIKEMKTKTPKVCPAKREKSEKKTQQPKRSSVEVTMQRK